MLREAQLVNGGQFLGPVGGRIVAEVMLGLLGPTRRSYLNAEPHWQPHLGGTGSGAYQITDFLRSPAWTHHPRPVTVGHGQDVMSLFRKWRQASSRKTLV